MGVRTRLWQWWENLRASYWFVPALMSLAAVALSFVTIKLDEELRDDMVRGLGWIYTGGPEGARGVLSTIASSTITVAGVTFSITIVTLSLATSQFGPRLLRNFMRDTGNQFVLGAFTSIYLYCLLVLRTVRGTDELNYVPHLSVTIGVALAVLGVAILIFFIHHIAESIQVPRVLGIVNAELEQAIDRLFPQKLGTGVMPNAASTAPGHHLQVFVAVEANQTGYIQYIDADKLFDLARNENLLVRLLHRPGDFVLPGMPIAELSPNHGVGDMAPERLRSAIILGSRRTAAQDAGFAFQQLVEIALRALSPSINDPFTALNCVDYLASGLCRLFGRELPSRYRIDDDGVLRLVTPPATYGYFARLALFQVAEASSHQTVVRERIVEHLTFLRSRTSDRELLQELEGISCALKMGEAEA